MTTETKHTPTPEFTYTNEGTYFAIRKDGEIVADVDAFGEPEAAFIVRACSEYEGLKAQADVDDAKIRILEARIERLSNSHDALVGALKLFTDKNDFTVEYKREVARKALAAAQVQP